MFLMIVILKLLGERACKEFWKNILLPVLLLLKHATSYYNLDILYSTRKCTVKCHVQILPISMK